MDAPFGFMGREGREPGEERPNSLCSNTGRELLRASLPGGQPAGVGSKRIRADAGQRRGGPTRMAQTRPDS